MLSFYRKYWRTAFDIAMIVLTVYLIMLAFSYIYSIAAPILLAIVIYWCIEPLARWMNKLGIKKSIASALSILLFILIILSILTAAGYVFINQINKIKDLIPIYTETLQDQIVIKLEYWMTEWNALPSDVTLEIQKFVMNLADSASRLASQFLNGLVGFLSSFTTFMINFVIAIILAYFLSVEIDRWRNLAAQKTPNTFKNAFVFLRENVVKGIIGYLKAQMKLISITFLVVLVALLLLGVQNAFAISLLAALFDLLPLLGVSTVFIPWIVYLFIVNNTWLAIWLSVLLATIILARQFLEPKITGDSLGVSAFTMLAFMIVSLSLFGVAGLILSPVLIILLKALYENGYLKKWVHLPEDEY